MEGVEVDHYRLAAELLQAFYVGVVADKDDRSVDLCLAFLVLLCVWFSEGFEASGRHRIWRLILFAMLFILIILIWFPSLKGLFRIYPFLLRCIPSNDPSFYIIQHFLDPIFVTIQSPIYLVNNHTDRLLLNPNGLVTHQIINLSNESLTRSIIRSIDLFIMIPAMFGNHSC